MVLLFQLACWFLSLGQWKQVLASVDTLPTILHSFKDEYGDDATFIKENGFVNCSYKGGQPEIYRVMSEAGHFCRNKLNAVGSISEYSKCDDESSISQPRCGRHGARACTTSEICQVSPNEHVNAQRCQTYNSYIRLEMIVSNIISTTIPVGETVLSPSGLPLRLIQKIQKDHNREIAITDPVSILSPSIDGSLQPLHNYVTRDVSGNTEINANLPLQDAPYKVVTKSTKEGPLKHWFYLQLYDSRKLRAWATFNLDDDGSEKPTCRFITSDDKMITHREDNPNNQTAKCKLTITNPVCFPYAHNISITIEDDIDTNYVGYDSNYAKVEIHLFYSSTFPIYLDSTNRNKLEEICITAFPIDKEPCLKRNHCNCKFSVVAHDHIKLNFYRKGSLDGEQSSNVKRRVQSQFERSDTNSLELRIISVHHKVVEIYGGPMAHKTKLIKSNITLKFTPKLSSHLLTQNSLTEQSKKMLNRQCSSKITENTPTTTPNPCQDGIEYCECKFLLIKSDSVIINLLTKHETTKNHYTHEMEEARKIVQRSFANVTLNLAQGGVIQVVDPDQSSKSKLTMFKTTMKLKIMIGNERGEVTLYDQSIELLKAELKSALSTESDWCNEDCYFTLGTIKPGYDPSIETTIFYTREVPVQSSQEIDDIKVEVSRIVAAKQLDLMGSDSSDTAVTVTLKQVEKMSTISPKPNEPTPEASPDDEGNEDNGEGKQDGSVESGKGEGRKTFDNIKIFFTRSSPRYRGKRLDVESERRLLNHNCGVDGSIEQLASDREAVLKLQPATPEYLPILIIKNNGHRQRRYKRSFNSIQRSKLGRLRRGSDIPDIKTAIYNCLKTNGLSVKFEKGTGVRLVGAKQETKVYGMVKIFLEDNLPASLVGKALVPADKEKVEQLCYNAVKDTCTTCQFICKPVRTNHLPIQVKVAVTTNEKRKKPARQLRLKRDTPDLSNIQTSIQKYVKDHPLGKLSLSGGGAIELSGRPRAKLDYSLIIIPIAIYAVIIILICLAFIFRNYLPQITTVKDVFDSPSSAPKKDDAKDDPKTKTKTKTEK